MLSHNVIYLSATIIAQPIVSGWVCYGLLVSLMSHPSPANRRYRALWHCRDGQSGMRGKTHIIPTIQAYYHILSHDIFPYFPPIPWHVLHMLPPGFSRTRPCPVCFDRWPHWAPPAAALVVAGRACHNGTAVMLWSQGFPAGPWRFPNC